MGSKLPFGPSREAAEKRDATGATPSPALDSPISVLRTGLEFKVSRPGRGRETCEANSKAERNAGSRCDADRLRQGLALEQNLDLREHALKAEGCERVYADRISGTVVWKLDRLGRSLKHLSDTITALNESAVNFLGLQEEAVGTTTLGGQALLPCLRGPGRISAGHHPVAGPRGLGGRGRPSGRVAGAVISNNERERHSVMLHGARRTR
jgi:hypothetical protein